VAGRAAFLLSRPFSPTRFFVWIYGVKYRLQRALSLAPFFEKTTVFKHLAEVCKKALELRTQSRLSP
jgi:uncharacterized membrane protein YfbV (UPF0208 family)